jgi:hypothetical protein
MAIAKGFCWRGFHPRMVFRNSRAIAVNTKNNPQYNSLE